MNRFDGEILKLLNCQIDSDTEFIYIAFLMQDENFDGLQAANATLKVDQARLNLSLITFYLYP